jgi:hypothetical protein
MQRTLAILACTMAVAIASPAGQFVEIDSGDCIVKGEAINDNVFALTVGDCEDAIAFKYTKQGGYIKSDDGLCIGAEDNLKLNGTSLVLSKCASKAKSQKWFMYDDNTFKNGQKKCMTFDAEEDSLVQVNCDEEPSAFELEGCEVKPKEAPVAPTTTTVTAAPTYTPAPTPAYTCANFAASVQPGNPCPQDFFVPSNFYTAPCTAGQYGNCVQTCCAPLPKPAYRTCGQYAVEMGGPLNVCKSSYGDFQLTPYADKIKCSAQNNKDCFYKCCEEVKPTTQTCEAFVDAGTNYKPACLPGTTPIADLANTVCKADGSNCRDVCCEMGPLPPMGNATCADWTAAGNKCPDLVMDMPLISCKPNMGVQGCDQATCCAIPRQ